MFIDETDTKYDMSATLGGGNDKFVITNAEVTGDLNVNSGAGNDQLCMKYVETGSTRLATGAGDDVFEMGDVDLGVASNLNLGGGADSVSIIGPVAGTGTLNGSIGMDQIENTAAIGGLGLTGFEKYA